MAWVVSSILALNARSIEARLGADPSQRASQLPYYWNTGVQRRLKLVPGRMQSTEGKFMPTEKSVPPKKNPGSQLLMSPANAFLV